MSAVSSSFQPGTAMCTSVAKVAPDGSTPAMRSSRTAMGPPSSRYAAATATSVTTPGAR